LNERAILTPYRRSARTGRFETSHKRGIDSLSLKPDWKKKIR